MRWVPFVLVASAGCSPATAGLPPVHYVATRTAGVMFVVVHPTTSSLKHYEDLKQPGDDALVNSDSQYLLICDGRKSDGMHCDVATEAALKRFSAAPAPTGPVPAIDEGVGTVPDLNVGHRELPAEPGATVAPAPAPAPAQAPAPAPAPASAPAAAGGKK